MYRLIIIINIVATLFVPIILFECKIY